MDQNIQQNGLWQAVDSAARTQVLLDAMPLSIQIWDKNMNIVDCNDENTRLFKLEDKKEFLDNFYKLSPECQPDGSRSVEGIGKCVKKAFEEGRCTIEWMHCGIDGTPLPVEVTLVLVRFGGEGYVVSYLRDLRENKKMIREIEQRDNLLNTVISNYSGIIWCVDSTDTITLFNGRFLGRLGLKPKDIEGKKITEALLDKRFSGILECIRETFVNGEQDFSAEVDDKTYRIRTTRIYDKDGRVESVMGSFDDITERTQLQKELKAALTEAREANSAKTDFLAKMSHEMRTPLNAIIGLSELALECIGLNDEIYSYLEKINNAGGTLLSTVNDILDISKIEAGKFSLVPVKYDTPSLINDAITQSIMHIGSKQVKFVLSISENLPLYLYGDDLRIKQMLNNLLSNAFKYTLKGSVELSVRCEQEGENVRMIMQVKDTGTGIRKEDMKDLFSDYAQMDALSNRKIEGTGLGLPITKKLAEMMGGSIYVESEYGKGSVFTVIVMQQSITTETIGAETVESLRTFQYSAHRRHKSFRLIRISMPYARVLVVDDVVTNLDVVKGMMKPYGMKIDYATSGQQAIDAIREEKVKYNAIFMDHMMPEMNGIEATRIIREEIGTEYAKTVPIIALTANAIIGNEEMFLSKGFQAFLPKPVDIIRLDSVLRQWVRDKDKEREDAGIDMLRGIERFGGDTEAYLHVLRSYANNTPPVLDKIREVSKDTLADYTVHVHGISGSSQSICAEQVGEKAKALEKAARAGDFGFINANNPIFIKAVEKLMASIANMLDEMDAENPRPRKDCPDKETLEKLKKACERYKMDAVDDAMNELEAYEYRSGGDLIKWLRENVDKMNFTEIKEKLL